MIPIRSRWVLAAQGVREGRGQVNFREKELRE